MHRHTTIAQKKGLRFLIKHWGTYFFKKILSIALRINGQCSVSSTTGIITGNIRPQTQIVTASTGCIFLSGNKEVAPVQKNGDQNQYDSTTQTFTFTRTATTFASGNGRAEMNFCFTKPTSILFTVFNTYQKQYLSHTKQIYEYCDNAVHNASKSTEGTYEMDINIPTDTGTATAKSVIVQWHGRPRRLVYKDSSGSIHQLSNPLSNITDTASLNSAKDDFDAVITAGGTFNQGGYPPLSVSIESNKFVVVARYDNRRYNDKSVRCNLNKATYPVGTTKKCLDTASQKLYVTVIYRDNLTNFIDQWKHLKLIVNWKPLGTYSRVRVYVDGTRVKEWSGLLGRDDEYGPYMKYGVYASYRSTNFKLKVRNAVSDVIN